MLWKHAKVIFCCEKPKSELVLNLQGLSEVWNGFSTKKLGFLRESKMCMDILSQNEDNLSSKVGLNLFLETCESYLLLYLAKISACSHFANALRGLECFFLP